MYFLTSFYFLVRTLKYLCKKNFAHQNKKKCPQTLLIIPIDQNLSVQQVFGLWNWNSFIVLNFLIFEVVTNFAGRKNSLGFLWSRYNSLTLYSTQSNPIRTRTGQIMPSSLLPLPLNFQTVLRPWWGYNGLAPCLFHRCYHSYNS